MNHGRAGNSRDLPTIDAHIDRLYKNNSVLWNADDLVLKMDDGVMHTRRDLLLQLRNDVATTLSTFASAEAVLQSIASMNGSDKDAADKMREIAKSYLEDKQNGKSDQT